MQHTVVLFVCGIFDRCDEDMTVNASPTRALPDPFIAYHARGERLEGPISSTVLRWFQLWSLTDIQMLNDQYRVAEHALELVGFGSDGGGEMLAFNEQKQVVIVPFIGMEMRYAKLVANSWVEFEKLLVL